MQNFAELYIEKVKDDLLCSSAELKYVALTHQKSRF